MTPTNLKNWNDRLRLRFFRPGRKRRRQKSDEKKAEIQKTSFSQSYLPFDVLLCAPLISGGPPDQHTKTNETVRQMFFGGVEPSVLPHFYQISVQYGVSG